MTEQADKMRETMISKLGSEEAYLLWRKETSSKGGRTGGNGLRLLTKEQRSAAGKAGGRALWDKLKKEGTVDEDPKG